MYHEKVFSTHFNWQLHQNNLSKALKLPFSKSKWLNAKNENDKAKFKYKVDYSMSDMKLYLIEPSSRAFVSVRNTIKVVL